MRQLDVGIGHARRQRCHTGAGIQTPNRPRGSGRRPRKSKFAFLTLPRYSMIALSSAVEPLRMANLVTGQQRTTGRSSASTVSPCRRATAGSLAHRPARAVGPVGHPLRLRRRRRARRGDSRRCCPHCAAWRTRHGTLGALCTGGYALAKAGLLDKYRATIHWENLSALREEFPRILLSDQLFTHRSRSLHLLRRHRAAGPDVASDQDATRRAHRAADFRAVHSRARRNDRDRQYVPLRAQIGVSHESLIKVAQLDGGEHREAAVAR